MKKVYILTAYIIACIIGVCDMMIDIKSKSDFYSHVPRISNYNSLQSAFKENIGVSFIQGQLVAVNPIEGKYSYIKKKYQTYEAHIDTRIDEKGNVHTTVSHDWETNYTEELYADAWQFYNIRLPITKLPWVCNICTERIDSNHRIVYSGCNYIYDCTIRGEIKNNTINSPTYYFDKTIEKVIESKTSYLSVVCVVVGAIMIGLIINKAVV